MQFPTVTTRTGREALFAASGCYEWQCVITITAVPDTAAVAGSRDAALVLVLVLALVLAVAPQPESML